MKLAINQKQILATPSFYAICLVPPADRGENNKSILEV